MTINDLANVHCATTDNLTGKEITHSEKYGRVIAVLGYEEVKKCIPFTLDEIKKALPGDRHLNGLPMAKWNAAAGFRISGGNVYYVGSPLTAIYRKHNVTAFSPADGVCILKEAARLWGLER